MEILKRIKEFKLKEADLKVFGVCFLFAFLFWLFSTLSQEYTISIEIPVKYTDLPKKKLISNKLPKTLVVNLSGAGKDILWQKMLTEYGDLNIAVNQQLTYRKTKSKGYIEKDVLFKVVDRQFNSNIQIQDIFPENIELFFEPKLIKKIPIEADVEYTNLISSFNSFIEISPDSVEISGPHTVIRGIKYWKTEMIDLEGVDNNYEAQVNLLTPDNRNLSIEQKSINFKISIDQLIMVNRTIPIQVKNAPEGLKLFKSEVDVSFYVPTSRLGELDNDLIQIGVDFHEVDIQKDKAVHLRVNQFPIYIKNVRLSDPDIKYIIQKQ